MNDFLHDVLVVGAGAAGLAAACALAHAGKRVALVEARNRVGGRIHTVQCGSAGTNGPLPIELGAEFIHGLPPATWGLVRRAKLETRELSGSALVVRNGQLANLEPHADIGNELQQMTAWLADQPAGCDIAFADYLALHAGGSPGASAASNYVEGFNAADRHRIGVAGLAMQQRAEDAIEGHRLFRLTAGYDAIPRALLNDLARAGGVLLPGRPVRQIQWSRGEVRLLGTDFAGNAFEFAGRRAIVTVPLGVLQAETIEFQPRPEALLRAAHRLAMGCAMRVVLIFRSRFWCDSRPRALNSGARDSLQQLSFLFTPADTPSTWWTPNPDPLPMLTAWAGGPKAAAWQRAIAASTRPDAALKECLEALGRAFKLPLAKLERSLVGWRTYDWLHDEFTRGAYSYVPTGALDAPGRMTVPVDDTLLFAGEHTDVEGHWGTVHAALGSGARAAAELLAAYA